MHEIIALHYVLFIPDTSCSEHVCACVLAEGAARAKTVAFSETAAAALQPLLPCYIRALSILPICWLCLLCRDKR
jgi:hypothetical protein